MSTIYACSSPTMSMMDNLARDFGYPPHFLVVSLFQGFLMKLAIYKSTKYILGIF